MNVEVGNGNLYRKIEMILFELNKIGTQPCLMKEIQAILCQ